MARASLHSSMVIFWIVNKNMSRCYTRYLVLIGCSPAMETSKKKKMLFGFLQFKTDPIAQKVPLWFQNGRETSSAQMMYADLFSSVAPLKSNHFCTCRQSAHTSIHSLFFTPKKIKLPHTKAPWGHVAFPQGKSEHSSWWIVNLHRAYCTVSLPCW